MSMLLVVLLVVLIAVVLSARAQARAAAIEARRATIVAEVARLSAAATEARRREEEDIRLQDEREERDQLAQEAACDHHWEFFGDWRQCKKCGASQNMDE